MSHSAGDVGLLYFGETWAGKSCDHELLESRGGWQSTIVTLFFIGLDEDAYQCANCFMRSVVEQLTLGE